MSPSNPSLFWGLMEPLGRGGRKSVRVREMEDTKRTNPSKPIEANPCTHELTEPA